MPRSAMRSLLILVVAGLVGAQGEWPQFRGNPQLTGVAAGSVPVDLKLLWSFDAGESIESSAAISGGTVYLGSYSKDLLAIDLETGKLRWKYRATDVIGESSPAVAGGIVYVASNTASGTIYAVNATTGALVWSRTPSPQQFIFGSPVVADGRLYAVSDNGHVYAFADVPSTATLAPSLFEPLTIGVIVAVVAVAAAVVILVRRSRRGR